MSARKTERLLNLVICLLAARQYVTKEKIRATVAGYQDCQTDEAFERMFERDKDDLRAMGIPLQTGINSAWFDDEPGYRIEPSEYALPDISLHPDEVAVLGLAARVWQQTRLARAASDAVLKLAAGGVETGEVSLAGIEPLLNASEPAFEPLWQAVRDRQAVSFRYRSVPRALASKTSQVRQRRIEPWGIVGWHGRWYLVGHDRDRAASRIFRLDRIIGEVAPLGPPGAVTVPEGVDIRAQVMHDAAEQPAGMAQLRLRTGAGFPLRRHASSVTADEPGWDRLELPYHDAESTGQWLAGFGADVVVLDPPQVRQDVLGRLTAATSLSAPKASRIPAQSHDAPQVNETQEASAGLELSHQAEQDQTGFPEKTEAATPGRDLGAGTRLARLLSLIPYLLARPGARVDHVAQAFGVSEDQLVKDLKLIWFCGLPGYLPSDLIEVDMTGGEIHLNNADVMARPLRLARDEALALLAALQMLASIPTLAGIHTADDPDLVNRVIAKVEQAAGTLIGHAQVALRHDSEPNTVAVARQAVQARQRLHVAYYTPSRDEVTERDVDPMRVVLAAGCFYLEGWCHRAQAVRLFRLDRVAAMTLLDIPTAVPSEAKPLDLMAGLFHSSSRDLLVTLELTPAGRWVAEYYPCESVTELADGGVRISVRSAELGWVRRLALRLGETGRLVNPPEVVAAVQAEAVAALAGYD